MTEASKGHVEIITNGVNSFVFLDGVHVPRVIAFEVLTEMNEAAQRVKMMFIAEKITYRKAEPGEFTALAEKVRGIPSSPKAIEQVECRRA